jgi:sec-independent protein translocase protein TatA
MMGDVAKGLKSFKLGMADEDDDKRQKYEEQRRRQLSDDKRPQDTIDITPRPSEPAAPPPRNDESR